MAGVKQKPRRKGDSMNNLDELLQARAEIHGIRSMFRLLAIGEQDVDTTDGLLLAESAENRINHIIETTGGKAL